MADYLVRRTARYARAVRNITGIEDIYMIRIANVFSGVEVTDYLMQTRIVSNSRLLDETRQYVKYISKKYPTVKAVQILVCDEVSCEVSTMNMGTIGETLLVSNLNIELK